MVCGVEKHTNIANQKICSDACRKGWYGRYSPVNGVKIPSGTVGAISELVVCSDLLKTGYSVFRSVSPSCFCDLIAIRDGVVKKIEVRTGYRGVNGKILFPKNTHTTNGKPTDFAVYIRSENTVEYIKAK